MGCRANALARIKKNHKRITCGWLCGLLFPSALKVFRVSRVASSQRVRVCVPAPTADVPLSCVRWLNWKWIKKYSRDSPRATLFISFYFPPLPHSIRFRMSFWSYCFYTFFLCNLIPDYISTTATTTNFESHSAMTVAVVAGNRRRFEWKKYWNLFLASEMIIIFSNKQLSRICSSSAFVSASAHFHLLFLFPEQLFSFCSPPLSLSLSSHSFDYFLFACSYLSFRFCLLADPRLVKLFALISRITFFFPPSNSSRGFHLIKIKERFRYGANKWDYSRSNEDALDDCESSAVYGKWMRIKLAQQQLNKQLHYSAAIIMMSEYCDAIAPKRWWVETAREGGREYGWVVSRK